MKKDNKSVVLTDCTSYLKDLFGVHDKHVKIIEDAFNVNITVKGDDLYICGDKRDISTVRSLICQLLDVIKNGNLIEGNRLNFAVRLFKDNNFTDLKQAFSERIKIEDRFITPTTVSQREYIYAIKNSDIIMGIGPAGTGKTYLSMAMAVNGFILKRFKRIMLVRPAVEAGESLGFLPGDLYEKINPYLRPLYDALYDMMDSRRVNRLLKNGLIEIVPLAYMRGRTLNDSFIILDEAQNSTPEQMKMFLTRLGINSKAVITGDITQIDLPEGKSSGLVTVQNILKGVDGIEFVYFSENDVVRHELVQKIVNAYGKYENRR